MATHSIIGDVADLADDLCLDVDPLDVAAAAGAPPPSPLPPPLMPVLHRSVKVNPSNETLTMESGHFLSNVLHIGVVCLVWIIFFLVFVGWSSTAWRWSVRRWLTVVPSTGDA